MHALTMCSCSVVSGMEICPECKLPYNQSRVTFGLDIEEAVREMRHRIHLRTKLTASAGWLHIFYTVAGFGLKP